MAGERERGGTNAEAAVVRLRAALRGLARGSCFCEMAIGNPNVRGHDPQCIEASAVLAATDRMSARAERDPFTMELQERLEQAGQMLDEAADDLHRWVQAMRRDAAEMRRFLAEPPHRKGGDAHVAPR